MYNKYNKLTLLSSCNQTNATRRGISFNLKTTTNLKKSVVSGWNDGVRQIFIYTEFDDKEGK